MSSALAAVVLAHDDPAKVHRLIAALDGVDIFLHCAANAQREVARQILSDVGPNVQAIRRRRTDDSSWSLVEAELAGLELALERSRAEHLIVMSGSCYPLIAVADLEDELARWRGLSRLELHPMPYRGWDTPRNPDGGLWRLRRRYLTVRGTIVRPRGVPVPTFRRPIPPELCLHASSNWKILARHHAAALLRVLDERRDLVRFWSTTFQAVETCAASILRSPALVGRVAEEVRDDHPWYIDWGPGPRTHHPLWLTDRDFQALEAATAASPRKLFARKISSREGALLDRIDEDLRA
jgi:hypothetical protein